MYGTARIGLHREFSNKMKDAQGGANLSAVQSSGSAMLAGALASIVGTPYTATVEGKRNFTAPPRRAAQSAASLSKCALPMTFTLSASSGLFSPRVESNAARCHTSLTSCLRLIESMSAASLTSPA